MYSEKKIKKKLPIEHVEKCLKCWLFHITTCKKNLKILKHSTFFVPLKIDTFSCKTEIQRLTYMQPLK